jgi:hypothetical protein
MTTDEERLRQLNIEIGAAETRGDRDFLENLLAPVFAMRRANGSVVDRAQFLEGVAVSGKRDTEVQSVRIQSNRAIVDCTVTMATPDGTRRFHNLRLFTRASADDSWMLLAWANEPTG